MTHTIGIVGHAARADMVDRLTEQVWPDVVSIDDGSVGCDGNHRAVWATLLHDYPESLWTVVLEDDALPVANFDRQLEAALKVAPTPLVSLYLGRLRPIECQPAIRKLVASNTDAHWFVANRLAHGVGVALRTSLVPDMLAHIAQPPASTRPVDEAISRWAATARVPVSYTWPSLVDHADEPTVIGKHDDGAPRRRGRVAWRTGQRSAWRGLAAALAWPEVA